jgi:hypothetical protein
VVAGDAASEVDGTSSVIGENDPVMVDISTFTTTKILDKRSSLCGVEYRCEFEPLGNTFLVLIGMRPLSLPSPSFL